MLASDLRFLIVVLLIVAFGGAALGAPEAFFIFLTSVSGVITAFLATVNRRKGDDDG